MKQLICYHKVNIMTTLDTDDFRIKIITATSKAINKIKEQMPQSEICGLALYSDSEASSLAPAFNCKTHLASLQAEYPEDAVYFKWSPNEWSHESYGEEFFTEISLALRQLSESTPEGEDLKKHRKNVFDVCMSALKELRKSELIESIYVFSATDYSSPQEEVFWIKAINSPLEAAEFEDWLIQN